MIADWIAQFEVDYFARKSRTSKSETTWRDDYLKIFNKLPKNVTLSVEVLKETILSTAPDSRTRRRAVMVLTALAKFADVEVNSKSLAGFYSPRTVAPRDLPDDLTIATWFYQLPAGCWRWACGVLATYPPEISLPKICLKSRSEPAIISHSQRQYLKGWKP